jgi:hypothetical protein
MRAVCYTSILGQEKPGCILHQGRSTRLYYLPDGTTARKSGVKKLLINWVYYHAIGHTIEALRCAQNYRNANPELEIAVALNARGGVDLAHCLPAIDRVYPIDVDAFEAPCGVLDSLEAIPQDWDYYIVDPRHKYSMGWKALDRCEQAFHTHIRARHTANDYLAWERLPLESRSIPLALKLPAAAHQFADDFLPIHRQTRMTLLFGSGAEPTRTPSISFWRKLIGQLIEDFDDLEIILLGALKPGQTMTQGITREDIDGLLREFSQVRDGFDLGLLNQLAIAERCDLHISPHTGMSFAVQCVGVPWLVIAGGDVAENIVNGVPFVSIYPECEFYPCGPWFAPQKNPMLPECAARREKAQPFLCLSEARLAERLPDILAAAHSLVNRDRPYLECVHQHYQAMLPRLGKQDGEPFMDNWPDALSEQFVFGSKA